MFSQKHRRGGSWSPSSDVDDEFDEMNDIYGQTPPRTRYNRRQRERKQKMMSIGGDSKYVSPKETYSKSSKPTLCRRNTLDTIIFNKMCDQADKDQEKENAEEVAKENSRKCKRSLKMTRNSERDLKLDIDTANQCSRTTEHATTTCSNMKVLCGVIETRNRFRCLQSKPVDVCKKKQESTEENESTVNNDEIQSKNLKERQIFHDTFSYLIRLGSGDWDKNCRRQMSSEETRWQSELKDLIWLELQAFHADRSLFAQDEYLCKQRESIGSLLTEIINYRYDPKSSLIDLSSATSSSSDSGFEGSLTPSIFQESELYIESTEVPGTFYLCPGCLSMHCRSCLHSQMAALKQVEDLLNRLETAEALFPSSHAFGLHYPEYKSQEFIDRVKAMCLWYNMTRHHRLKVQILGKLLMLLDNNERNYSDLMKKSFESKLFVKFDIALYENVDDLSKSNQKGDSSCDPKQSDTYSKSALALFNHNRLNQLDFYLMEFDRQSYRKYIEEVLKTRGLSKSLNFLERLHTYVLRKANIALTKYENSEMMNEEYEGDKELKRYGMWSAESKALNLPSYASAFIFLSRVPLDVVHEFLRMRLEQKPEQPGPLSIRQLMREMREGLRIACIYRNRFIAHSKTALAWGHSALDCDNIDDFDESLKSVFQIYLNYLKQWIEMMQDNNYHKLLIDDEWVFVTSIVENINQGYNIGGIEFCDINRLMIEQIQDFLNSRPREIIESMEMIGDDDSTTKFQLMSLGREWQCMFVEARERILKTLNMARTLRRDTEKWCKSDELVNAIENLKKSIYGLKDTIVDAIEKFQIQVDDAEEPKNENDRLAYRIRVKEILHQAYRMGFDSHKEVFKIFGEDERKCLARDLVNFAMLWMKFVKTRCERGRGLRPRWANHGLEYLTFVCDPANTQFLTDEEFEVFKTKTDRCINHIIGSCKLADSNNLDKDTLKKLPISRAPSPAHHQKSISISKSKDNLKGTPSPSNEKEVINLTIPEPNYARHQRLIVALRNLENKLDDKRRSAELIGRITDRKSVDNVKVKVRRVTFTWQRGIKIGQGRFGKVYTVVNNQTGELLAMKEVPLQPGDNWAIRRVAEELQIFEGIIHQHLVRYYGIEIHHEEMLIFMEFCAEGTLESLVAASGQGLPEILIRKYAHQLLSAIFTLHSHGVVHRDIKSANIFLTDQGNCLKLGDFGSAVQIKAHTTMPGELKGFVGTQAYMAPEVFMKTETGGHGRAADIWSLGCCVIEMASGKRPWAEFDSNYQIMFKVGMGESPMPPKTLCKEGVDLITKCLQHDPKKRPTARTLLSHPFARNYDDVNADLITKISS
ncbi:mitogen-activated protein kinase kinase kinase 4 [Chelonus insularis]|uniref:mitogen-activated protein kinase kinase kinase 4 n=1 Tax=Chelonus insularis TaxID=460826 RepID=UPI00158AA104|nr:mitogen-activated protein kinase kinase kinase 4 [Chelonus insularis]XP_034936816.1 mitogen-activated protein kinase kinase kinase 4 [Chelonus insularis]